MTEDREICFEIARAVVVIVIELWILFIIRLQIVIMTVKDYITPSISHNLVLAQTQGFVSKCLRVYYRYKNHACLFSHNCM